MNGAFSPAISPLFHGSRCTALATDPMMVSHRVEGRPSCAGATAASWSWINPDSRRPSGLEVSFVRELRTRTRYPISEKSDVPMKGFKVRLPKGDFLSNAMAGVSKIWNALQILCPASGPVTEADPTFFQSMRSWQQQNFSGLCI